MKPFHPLSTVEQLAAYLGKERRKPTPGLMERRLLEELDDHPAFEWFEPEVSRIRTDTRRFVPRIVRWAENVANDREDLRETLIRAEFVEGGTIGPVGT